MSWKDTINREFHYVYFMKFDGDIDKLILQKEEVSGIHFLSINKAHKELKEHPNRYVPHGEYWSDVFTSIKNICNNLDCK